MKISDNDLRFVRNNIWALIGAIVGSWALAQAIWALAH